MRRADAHPVPLFVYVLQGEISVSCDEVGPITYAARDAFVEVFEWPHQAVNTGKGMVRFPTVNSGAVGVSNSVPLP